MRISSSPTFLTRKPPAVAVVMVVVCKLDRGERVMSCDSHSSSLSPLPRSNRPSLRNLQTFDLMHYSFLRNAFHMIYGAAPLNYWPRTLPRSGPLTHSDLAKLPSRRL